MDIIFGTFATDELKLIQHRAMRRGIQHRFALTPGKPRPGEPMTLSAWVGPDVTVDHMACYYTVDGSDPAGQRGIPTAGHVALFHNVEMIWDSLAWGYLARWETTIIAPPQGAYLRYRIGGWADGGAEIFADWPNAKEIIENATDAYFNPDKTIPPFAPGDPGRGATFAFYMGMAAPPAWTREAVIYQVLVDRFSPGDGKAWRQTSALNQVVGGTLRGVQDRLGHIADLGATCIWLSPTWQSPSHHGYDILDYMQTEPRLGGDAALHALVDAAHKRGLRILLDLPCNHISNESALFQEARRDPHSRYRNWFHFDDSPLGYGAYFNIPSMPTINLTNPETRDWMVGVARYWLHEFEVDGFRLDYAHGPGPNFWTYFNAACKDENPESLCFGEVLDAPEVQRTYVGRLDGCLDFYLNELLRKTFGWGTASEADLARLSARHHAYFPPDFVMPSFLDNHDMDRFLYVCKGNKDALRRAVDFQMRLPNPPIIYYGTEIGLNNPVGTREGGLDAGRVPMVWDAAQQDRALFAYYADKIRARQAR